MLCTQYFVLLDRNHEILNCYTLLYECLVKGFVFVQIKMLLNLIVDNYKVIFKFEAVLAFCFKDLI